LFFSSPFRPLEFAGHRFRFANVFRLRCHCAAGQQNIDGRARSRVINAISSADMNPHFGNAFTDRFDIAEINVALRSLAMILAFTF
jgi:hypothetical protein